MGNTYIPDVGRVTKTTLRRLLRKKAGEFLVDVMCATIAIIVLSPLVLLALIAVAIDFIRGKR